LEKLIDEPIPRKRLVTYIQTKLKKNGKKKNSMDIELKSIDNPSASAPTMDEHKRQLSVDDVEMPVMMDLHGKAKIKVSTMNPETLRVLQSARDQGALINKEDVVIGEVIAKGSFGMVKTGVYKKDGKAYKVAVKEVPMGQDEGSKLEDIRHEVDLMMEMRNPNVLDCFGFWFDNASAFIVMELCQKGDLFHVKHDMSRDLKLDFLLQISCGMTYLHSKQIVHRDLKPQVCTDLQYFFSNPIFQNLLVTKNNVVKLCDFGSRFVFLSHFM